MSEYIVRNTSGKLIWVSVKEDEEEKQELIDDEEINEEMTKSEKLIDWKRLNECLNKALVNVLVAIEESDDDE